MNEQYLKSAKALNELTLFFATVGYQTESTFHSNYSSMHVTIFFTDIKDKKKIEHLLNKYAKENDFIEYRNHKISNISQFYTLTLYKNVL